MTFTDHLQVGFHPAVERWLVESFSAPTPPQKEAWPAISRGEHVLVAAPTGSGKTLCAFLSAIDRLVVESQAAPLPDETRVLYVSPLKALSRDIERNLERPLSGVESILKRLNLAPCSITTAVRTGDTPAHERSKQTRHPAHLFVTTPESLYVLLTSESGRKMLSTVQAVIIDEVHAMVRDKRGSHLALSLERLDHLTEQTNGTKPQRIGLSATQKPIDRVSHFLTGCCPDTGKAHPCTIVDTGHQRELDLSLCIPDTPLEAVISAESWKEVYDLLASLIQSHKTTLIFTNTRRLAERITRFLAERLGENEVTSHHGSLSRQRRWAAEQALKSGRLKALVATASLELGIDVGDVDLVCQMGSPGSISTLLQRVGRSGHFVGGTPKGRLFPLSRDELVESIALLQAVQLGELDAVEIPEAPLDILAQQIVATVVPGEFAEDELYRLVRRAFPYRTLTRAAFDDVVTMLADGYATSRGRRGALLHHDSIGKRIKARRAARLTALTNGGAIPDNFDYEVLLEPTNTKIGTVHEDFAIESMAGDIFQLGNTSYQILKVDPGVMRVSDAHGQPPSIPFWIGEAPSRSDELTFAVSRLRNWAASISHDASLEPATHQLARELAVPEEAARQVISYLVATNVALGHMPTQATLVAERFFDEGGGMHVVIHSTFGSRVNRAFGLALRKRFCRSFNVELQAAAGEDAIILSLGPMHSFPLDTIFSFLNSKTVRSVLIQALLDAPLFQTRWRWNASRALAVLRFRGGKKVPPRFQRMDSDDLLALCFPDQVACLENIPGDREIPAHPLVEQTIRDSLTEAMDVTQLERILDAVEQGAIRCVARDLTEPSPLAHEILNARPYAFLDDAPLEERRTQAVQMRRFADPNNASDLGVLNPDAITQVLRDAAPQPRDADELHDVLLVHAFLPVEEAPWPELLEHLRKGGRVFRCEIQEGSYWVAAERLHWARAVHPEGAFSPSPIASISQALQLDRESALIEMIRGRLEYIGPTTAEELARSLLVEAIDAQQALLALESEGFILRGSFRANSSEEFCERRLLARIHRLTLNRLRREIEPVSPSQFIDFLTHHQSVQPSTQREGRAGTLAILEQLAGFPIAAASWEADVLRTRVRNYGPNSLDELCLSGQVTWNAQRRHAVESRSTQGPIKSTPISIVPRDEAFLWRRRTTNHLLSADATRLAEILAKSGALFFDDLKKRSGLLTTQTEKGLAELIASGLANTDSFAGLRALLTPESKRRDHRKHSGRHRRGAAPTSLNAAGRISWLGPVQVNESDSDELDLESLTAEDSRLESIAWTLLARWGIVFRRILEREAALPSWGQLLRVYHRLEARGEIRGGRFITGFSGEQFATSESLQLLRQIRRQGPSTGLIRLAATDPLNLMGIITPGARLSATPKNQFLLKGGQFVGVLEAGEIKLLPFTESGEAEAAGAGPATEQQIRDAFRAGPRSSVLVPLH